MAGPSTAPSEAPDQTVARNFLALGAGEAVARLVAFGATIYVARTVGVAGYGLIGFALAVVLYLNRVADFGFDLGLGAREVSSDPAALTELVPSAMSLRLAIAAVSATLLAAGALLFMSEPDGSVVALYGLTLLAVGGSTRWVHLGLERAGDIARARTAGEALVVVLVLVMVHGPGDIARVPLAQFLGDSFAALWLVWMLRRRGIVIPVRFDLQVLRSRLPRARNLVVGALLGLTIYNSDLILLRVFRDTVAVGHYAAAYTLIGFLINIGIAYSASLLPTLTRALQRDEHGELYRTAMAHVVAAGVPVALGGALVAPGIIHLVFGPAFAPAAPALALLLWIVPIGLIRDVPLMGLMAKGREDLVMYLTLAAVIVNTTLNLALIPRWGIGGAAVATVVSEAFRAALTVWAGWRHGFPAPPVARFWRTGVAAAAMAAIVLVARPLGLVPAILLGGAAYLAALTLVGGIVLRPGRLPALNV